MKNNLKSNLYDRFGENFNCEELSNSLLALIAGRGSCRQFTDDAVSLETVRTLCAIALSSPTKSDLQQRDIVIVESDEQRHKMTDLLGDFPWVKQAPLLLVFCGNNRRQRQISEWRDRQFVNDHLDAFFNASVDAGIALSTFVLAAESIGLGCCPLSVVRNYAEEVSHILALPEHVFPVAGLALGWPSDQPPISLRLPTKITVHLNEFSEKEVKQTVEDYDYRRQQIQPMENQRYCRDFGHQADYGWSEDKARQYAKPERAGFGRYIKSRGFKLD